MTTKDRPPPTTGNFYVPNDAAVRMVFDDDDTCHTLKCGNNVSIYMHHAQLVSLRDQIDNYLLRLASKPNTVSHGA